MNGYDAQDMAAQGADGFRNGYQAGYADAVKAIEAAQPAAAQEAVAWLSKDEAQLALFKAIQAIRFGNPTDDKMILDNLRHEGLWIGRYANAPVTAAPAEPDLDAHDPASGELAAQWLYRNGFKELAYVIRTQLDMRGGRIRELSASTPAAPGIDTGKLRELAGAIVASLNDSPFGNVHTAIAMRRAKQIVALIGGSPKGGSEARDAARYRWLREFAVNGSIGIPFHGWLNCDEPASEWDSAIDVAMQAGDAEVQP